MKKQISKKLALATETLAPLQGDALATVHGGNNTNNQTLQTCITAAGKRTCFLCIPDQPQ